LYLKELIRTNAQSVYITRTFSDLDRIVQMLRERNEIMRVAQVLNCCAYQVLRINFKIQKEKKVENFYLKIWNIKK